MKKFQLDQKDRWKYSGFTLLSSIPIIWTTSYLELKMINEAWPLSINIGFYFLFMSLICLISLVFICYLIWFIKGLNIKFNKFDHLGYYFIGIITVLLSFIFGSLLTGTKENLRYMNFRVILTLPAVNLILPIICNSVYKRREKLLCSPYILLMLADLAIYLIFRYPLELINTYQSDFMFIQVFVLIFIFYTISCLQLKYGSRFFLPNWWRSKIYEFRRVIAEDFDLAKTDEAMWPEWGYWMQKLHLSSLLSNEKSLRSYEGLRCNSIYMKTQDNYSFHYFCLDYIISQKKSPNYPCKSIDEYND